MNAMYKWSLGQVCKDLAKQGYNHKSLITEYFRIMRKAVQEEFTEDSNLTIDNFLEECFKDSMKDN